MAGYTIGPNKLISETALAKLKDKEIYLFNAIEGTFDLALKFNENKILTAKKQFTGNEAVDDLEDFEIITDNEGNVVIA